MTLIIIVFIAVLNQIAFSGSRVVVSLHALELGASQFVIGLIIALYSLCPMLLSIAIGRLADRSTARRPMLIGSAAMGAALLLPALWPGLAMLCVMAFVLGLFHQYFNIPMEAAVGGIGGAENRARNYALLSMGWSIASFLGPVIAGLSVDYIGHTRGFIVLAVLMALPLPILWLMPRLLPATPRHGSRDQHGSVLDLLRLPSLRATFIAGGIVASAQDLFQFYMPIYGHAIGLPASAIGVILGVVALAAFVIRGMLPLLVKNLSEAEILIYAVFISAGAYLLMPMFSNPYALAAIAFALGLGVGSAQPMTMSLLYVLTPGGRIAEAIGVFKTVRNITHIGVPLLFGSVGAALGFVAVFASNSALLFAGGCLMARTRVRGAGGRSRET